MNTKKTVLILIGVVLVAFGIGALALNFGNNPQVSIDPNDEWNIGKFFSKNIGANNGLKENIDEEKTENIDGIKNINVSAPIARVNIISEDREDISIHYYGEIPPSLNTSLDTKKLRDKLDIQISISNRPKINNNNLKLYLDILVPNSYNENLKVNADLGDIRLENLELYQLNIQADLGNVKMDNIKANKMDIDCDLGNIIGNNIRGNANVNADLGNIELDYADFDYDLIAVSNLGSISITIPKNSNFNLDAKSDLGTVKTDFPVTSNEVSKTRLKGTVGNGGKDVKLNVDLGSIKVNTK